MGTKTSKQFLSPTTKLRQGNVFTLVCHSVHSGWCACQEWGASVAGGCAWQGMCMAGGHVWQEGMHGGGMCGKGGMHAMHTHPPDTTRLGQ